MYDLHEFDASDIVINLSNTCVFGNEIISIGTKETAVDRVGIICRYNKQAHRFDQNEFDLVEYNRITMEIHNDTIHCTCRDHEGHVAEELIFDRMCLTQLSKH